MSVNVTYRSSVTANETFTTVLTGESLTATHTAMDTISSLTSITTPPVSKMAAFTHTLTGGADSIDLATLTGTNGAMIDGTGLKVQLMKIQNPAYQGNGTTPNSPVTITAGNYVKANGSFIFVASAKIVLNGGEEVTWCGINHASVPVIAVTPCKTFVLTGTASDKINLTIIMG